MIDLISLQEYLNGVAHRGRTMLLPALHKAQSLYGWIPREAQETIARELKIPLADVHGVIEFYTMFYSRPIGKRIIRVCADPACALKGSERILRHLCDHHGIDPDHTTPDGSVTIEHVTCLGLCDQAPAALVDDQAETNINVDTGSYEIGRPRSLVYGHPSILTANCGNGTTSLTKYGEYESLRKALTMNPGEIIAEIKNSGLVGRGGAAFPTGIKWEGARNAIDDQKYIVCNADESEPGTFKDRVLLIDDPHRTIEGMVIAAYAIGASRGFIYLRGEYPYILPALENALSESRKANLLGENILGSGFSFDIEMRLGAGAYICGEETALFESIEGKRGFPRIKPPFPTTFGLFGKPTIINNVETLCNVPLIIAKGAQDFRAIGTEKSPGTKLFCVSGDVTQPGVYEIPFGVTLRELLALADAGADFETDKRMPKQMKAVLFGGAAGAFATSAHLDVKLTFEDLRAAGLPLGSGVVMVFDETRDLRETLVQLARFFAHESCGKCFPCSLGTQRQLEILENNLRGQLKPGDKEALSDIGFAMTMTSLCGLGQTAASAVTSAMNLFPEIVNG
jgi:NADH-quinone oxidoreductase subunit F